MKAIAVCPAKVILFGEHFVVGGNSALAMTIDLPTVVTAERSQTDHVRIKSESLRLEATFSADGNLTESSDLKAESTLRPIFEVVAFTLKKIGHSTEGFTISVKSSVPIGMGLGSSAATAVGTVSALTALLNSPLSKEEVFEAAYSLEKMVHGHPSGVDQATITFGGMISYRNGTVESTLEISKPPLLIIGNTGQRRSTGEFVGKVTKLRETRADEYRKIASEAQAISDKALDALRNGRNESLGPLMNENQRLLELVGVSSPELERLIAAARSAGALGAKLTGGGGGGCMIAVAETATYEKVSQAIQAAGANLIPSNFLRFGVETYLRES